ncbi:MAG: arginine N-succinyltransferase [Bdellovibrionales bacterium]|nr:arginine N-succinyltransferase [Bdellovibrionales bacterium]
MNFIVRSAQNSDLNGLYNLARQFTLLNLPADKKLIGNKIERSQASFSGKLSKDEAEYLFVVEDVYSKDLAGASLIVAKNGTANSPNFSFKVLKKERFSKELGIGFIHQILRLHANYDGPTEVGGLVVDRSYRRRPEKVGRLISLSRFLFIGMEPHRFENELHSEMAPPLTDEGRSEFWEALGRRFTGMPYQEADTISQQNNQFIKSLFPEEDIYLCLLDSKARLVLGRVAEETQAALHLLNKIGFTYKEEVDPFDGGPHLGVARDQVTLIKKARWLKASSTSSLSYEHQALIGTFNQNFFLCGVSACHIQEDEVLLPEKTLMTLNISSGDEVYLTQYE